MIVLESQPVSETNQRGGRRDYMEVADVLGEWSGSA